MTVKAVEEGMTVPAEEVMSYGPLLNDLSLIPPGYGGGQSYGGGNGYNQGGGGGGGRW